MAWGKLESTFTHHPKFRRLARRLGCSIWEAKGRAAHLWAWAIDYAPDGDLSDIDTEEIADILEWGGDPEKLVEAFVGAGLIDRTRNGLEIHQFYERQEGFKQAERAAKHRRRKRAEASRDDDVTDTSASRDRHIERERERREREERKEREERSERSEREEVASAEAAAGLDASASRSPIAQARAACLDRGWQWTAKARRAFDDLMPFDEDELARALVKTAGQDLSASGGSVYLAGVMRHSRTDALKAEEKSRAGTGKVNGSRLDSLDECKSAGDILANLFPQQEVTG